MNTLTERDDLRTPPEWAEHYGITGLVPEEWQQKERPYSGARARVDDERVPLWEMAMPPSRFRSLLGVNIARGYGFEARSKEMPPFRPTPEAVLDVLGDHRGWVPTAKVLDELVTPLGYCPSQDHLPKGGKAKVTKILKALHEEGKLVERTTLHRRGGPGTIPVSGGNYGVADNHKCWILASIYEEMTYDITLDRAEEERRRDRLAQWADNLGTDDVNYSHPSRPIYTDGVLTGDGGKVTLPWDLVEAIIEAEGES